MDFAENLENLKKDIANTLLKFKEDVFSKHKEYIERAEVKLKKWEEGLQEREGKVEVKEKEGGKLVHFIYLIRWNKKFAQHFTGGAFIDCGFYIAVYLPN